VPARENDVDVLVIGSGGAGCSATLAAREAGARVLVATKSALGASNTGRAQGGIQAALGEDDSPESHCEDTFAAGHRSARPELVRTLTHSAPEAIEWLERLGVAFSRDEGRLRLLRCGGASRHRLLQAGERTGADMIRALRAAVRSSGAEVWESCPLAQLEPVGEGWRATLAPGRNGERRTVRATAVVLAAGGGLAGEAARQGVGSTNHPDATPEVLETALALGAEGIELDSWQQHPTGSVWPPPLSGYALPETTRGYGATLHDASGERFVDELAPRDVVAAGIMTAVTEGRGASAPDGRRAVWLDTPAIDRENGDGFTAERLAYVYGRYRKAGVDITQERVLVYPVLHYRNGGLVIDEHASTTLPGLFACGEIAGGVHGRNRLMGNSLLDTVVYGRRAGRSAAERATA
jgi:succinate dehydrogenase / fumarate reductase flavoprotein subunit/L-aspartate oxidase